MRYAARSLAPLLLVALAPGCGGGSTAVDLAPPAPDLTTAGPRHSSYVPAGLHPADAKHLIVLGDSISTGTGASQDPVSYYNLLQQNDDSTWPAEKSTSLSARFGHPLDVIDVAMNGATTTDLVQSELPALDAQVGAKLQGHSIVVITIGGNDLALVIAGSGSPTGRALTRAVDNLRAAVMHLQDKTRFPDGTSIYVAAVYDPSDGEGHIQGCFFNLTLPAFVTALDVWRTRYIEAGTALGFAVIDALGGFHGHGHNHNHMSNPYYYAPDPSPWFYDCLHPNDRGHSEMRRLFFEAIDGTYRVTP